MQNIRLLAGAVGAVLIVTAFSAVTASAQTFAPNTPAPRVSHIGVQPYMRIPTGSRGEAATLKADQDAARLAAQPKKKGKKRR